MRKKLSFPVQGFLLQKKYPQSKVVVNRNDLIWYGEVRPTPISRLYKIKIICKKAHKPKVVLYGNEIDGIERDDFPHIYRKYKKKQMVELCLNMPIEFNYSLRITDTIIPWAQEWLFYYEIWLATGKWCGGGHTPS